MLKVHGLNSLDLKASNSLENLLVNNKDTKLKKAK